MTTHINLGGAPRTSLTPGSAATWSVGYYRCKAKAARNAEFPIHVIFAFDRDWTESVLRQRGLLGNRFLSRPPLESERRAVDDCKRAYSLKYRNVDELIEDERLAGVDDGFIDQLRYALRPNAADEALTD